MKWFGNALTFYINAFKSRLRKDYFHKICSFRVCECPGKRCGRLQMCGQHKALGTKMCMQQAHLCGNMQQGRKQELQYAGSYSSNERRQGLSSARSLAASTQAGCLVPGAARAEP